MGLRSKPELNGRLGSIIDFDDGGGRYLAYVKNHPTVLALHPSNCLLKVGACVRLYRLEVSEYNGKEAEIIRVHRKEHMYTVRCADKRIRVKFADAICYALHYQTCADVSRRQHHSNSPIDLQLITFVMVPLFFLLIVVVTVVIISEKDNHAEL